MELPRRSFLSLLFAPLLRRFMPEHGDSGSLKQIDHLDPQRAEPLGYSIDGVDFRILKTEYYWMDGEGRMWRLSNSGGCWECISIPFNPFVRVPVPYDEMVPWKNGEEYQS